MVGYPIGLCDDFNNKPIVRRGITATHIGKDYQGKKEFLVDMACFPGSSGSPVFIVNDGIYTVENSIVPGNRILLLGILYGGPQYTAKGEIKIINEANSVNLLTNIPTNLGICIKSQYLLDFEKMLKDLK